MFKSFLPKHTLALTLLLISAGGWGASFTINDPSCAGFVLSGTPPSQVISCSTATPPPPPDRPPAATTFNDNQRLWVAAAMGRPDNELIARLGSAAYTQGVQDRSVGGRLYSPTLFSQASMAAGGNAPPAFTWAAHTAAGEGSVVNGVWVWAPKMYPLFLALR